MAFPVIDLVAVRRPVSSASATLPRRRTGRMTITPHGAAGDPIVVPYAPREVEHSGLGGEFVTVPRPGLPSIIVYQNEQVPVMTFTLLLSDKPDFQASSPRFSAHTVTTAIAVIHALTFHAKKGTRLRVIYGQLESGLWHITGLSLRSIHRDEFTDEIVQAEMDVTMTQVSDVVQGVGPLTGGVRPPAPPPAPAPPQQTSARYYTMKRGDTLWAVSIRFYGTGTRWRVIADANRITNVRTIPVGKVLRIP